MFDFQKYIIKYSLWLFDYDNTVEFTEIRTDYFLVISIILITGDFDTYIMSIILLFH